MGAPRSLLRAGAGAAVEVPRSLLAGRPLLGAGAIACGALGALGALGAVLRHARAYSAPVPQRACIRILLLSPLLVVTSIVGLACPPATVYCEAVRGGYEAFVLYNFVALMLHYVGGPVDLVEQWRATGGTTLPACCGGGHVRLDRAFLSRIVQAVLQYVFVRAALVVVVPVLEALGKFGEGRVRWESGAPTAWLFIMVVQNLSLSLALTGLWMLSKSSRHLMEEHQVPPPPTPPPASRPRAPGPSPPPTRWRQRHSQGLTGAGACAEQPLRKFVVIKSVLFVTFWQGVVMTLLFAFDVLHPAPGGSAQEAAHMLVHFLLLIESLPLSIALACSFGPPRLYQRIGPQAMDEESPPAVGGAASVGGSRRGLRGCARSSPPQLDVTLLPKARKYSVEPEEPVTRSTNILSAIFHAIDPRDVVYHALASCSSTYARNAYHACELGERDAHDDGTPRAASSPGVVRSPGAVGSPAAALGEERGSEGDWQGGRGRKLN